MRRQAELAGQCVARRSLGNKKYEKVAMARNAKRRFPPKTIAAINEGSIIGLRAGVEPHRLIGVWAVVVQGRVFIRSWSLKPRSWWRTFLEEPRGAIQVGDREIRVRAVQTRRERLKDAVDQAYRDKYHTPGSLKFVRDLCRKKSRDTTTELAPRNA